MKITISTSVNAELKKVWEYWTSAEHITNWNFASDEWCCPKATNPMSVGETFSWRMEAKDGSIGFDFKGTYIDIQKDKSIAYQMEDGRNVLITFTETENGVIIEESFDAEGTNSDEQQRSGWQAILNNFKDYVENSN